MKILKTFLLSMFAIFSFALGGIFQAVVFSQNENNLPVGEAMREEKIKSYSADFINSSTYLLPLEIASVPVKKSDKADVDIAAKSAFVIDDATEMVLYNKEADKKMPIASLTKLTTAVTILELADRKGLGGKIFGRNYDLNKSIKVTKSALDAEGNSAFLEAGEKIKAKDLMTMMLIASSNDAAVLLAEDVSMSLGDDSGIESFMKLMNITAVNERMDSTHFSNPTGIDASGNYSTSRDVAKITRKFLHSYPDIFQITRIARLNVVSEDGKIDHFLENTNKLINDLPGIVGGKTGFTDEAGESLVLAVKDRNNEHQIIAVVIGATDRFKEMRRLVKWTFDSYEWKR